MAGSGLGSNNANHVLNRLGLPIKLIDMIRNDTLEAEVRSAQEHIRKLNEQMDAWEAANPHAVHLLPWYEARKAWKEAGRPSPEWYEALYMVHKPEVPIRKFDIATKLLRTHDPVYAKKYIMNKRLRDEHSLIQKSGSELNPGDRIE
jgi:hypothetical protein